MIDVINTEGIKKYLNGGAGSIVKTEVYDCVESTNTLLKAKAREGAEEGLVIVASRQTGGRGRMGRSFFSPEDTGVYLSILLKPEIKSADAVLVTTAAAVAVCRSLEALGVDGAGIKWVNDIFVSGKKVCGILTEAAVNPENGYLDFAVLGVGINIYSPEGGFPDEIKDIAGAVFENKEADLRNRFTAYFLNEFFGFYGELTERAHCPEYVERSLVIGKMVNVLSGDNQREALVKGIDNDCCLIVQYKNGEIHKLSSGEISIKLNK